MQCRIDQFTEYRRRIAQLTGGERLVMPPLEVVAVGCTDHGRRAQGLFVEFTEIDYVDIVLQ
ncbi:hypothetical protein ACFWBX_10110 [Streptomyces sp. NPDC059991]|uniref:hypothetical protein n=1 Tax=Streptomyces sp. NPDC059991 TaxID=3347028 RepID=UPI003693B630